MKNKKLVATVASLCLVVVAVVAAVVGVFAAVTQSARATFNVSYTARNVNATISLDSKGPTYTAPGSGSTRGTRSYAAETASSEGSTGWETETSNSTTFTAGETTRTTVASLSGKTYNFGWNNETTSTAFYGKAVYRFAFQNNSTNAADNGSRANVLNVSWTFGGSDANLHILFYTPKSTAEKPDELALDTIVATWDTNGDLNTGFGLPTGDSAKYISKTAAAESLAPIAEGATGYLFVVIIVKDIQKEVNLSVLTDTLSFVLVDDLSA